MGMVLITCAELTEKERYFMAQEKTERIDELTCLSHERALTKEEEEERKLLCQAFNEDIKAGTRQKPDDTFVQYNDGTCITLEESAKNRDKSADPNGVV
jgi:uncharacterized protein YnzC (UPF0291/DUF896 family)